MNTYEWITTALAAAQVILGVLMYINSKDKDTKK